MSEAHGVVLVTGASSGIGACCAAFLAKSGYRVYGGSRGAVTAKGVEPPTLDVADDASVARAIEGCGSREPGTSSISDPSAG